MSSAQSWIDVCNSALALIGEPAIETFEDNLTGALCQQHIYRSRNVVLRRYPFDSARKNSGSMAPLATPPLNPFFSSAFQAPSDLVRIVKIHPGYNRFYLQGNTILMNETNINVDYVWAVDQPAILAESVTEVIAAYLATCICYKITESLPLLQELKKGYKEAMIHARNDDSMEEYPETWTAEGLLTSRLASTFTDPFSESFRG